jgi:hypothetical protein
MWRAHPRWRALHEDLYLSKVCGRGDHDGSQVIDGSDGARRDARIQQVPGQRIVSEQVAQQDLDPGPDQYASATDVQKQGLTMAGRRVPSPAHLQFQPRG